MISLPLALSLTSSFTTIGALASFVALLGIALVSLLVFSQSREIKRLREWAGRAPERAAELEQRIGTQATAPRAGRVGAPAGSVRVTPRATPLVSAPVSSAVQASAAAATGSHPLTRATPRDDPAPAVPAATAATAIAAPEGAAPEGAAGQPTVVATPDALGVTPPAEAQEQVATGVEAQQVAAGVEAQEQAATGVEAQQQVAAGVEAQQQVAAGVEAQGSANGVQEQGQAVGAEGQDETGPSDLEAVVPVAVQAVDQPGMAESESTPAPATAAARATRSPLPPAPPAGARAAALRSSGTRPVRRPPSERGRVEAERERRAAGPVSRRPGQRGGASASYYRQQRSPVRGVALMIGAAIVGVLLIALIVSVLKGSSSPSPSGSASPIIQTKASSQQGSAGEAAQLASNPAEVAVVVLNGTNTAGLAHHLASTLQQSGYSRAEASSAVPPGSHSTTVVEYSSGHRADAQAVAKALSVNDVKPMESSTAQLASAATVVVIAGDDQSALFTGASGSTESAGTAEH